MFWDYVSTFWDKLSSFDREQWENFWAGLEGMAFDLISKSNRLKGVVSLTNQHDVTDYYDIKIGPLYSCPIDLDPSDPNSNNIIKPIGTVVLEPIDGVYNDLIEITADDYYKIRSIGVGQYVVIGDKYFKINNLMSSEESNGTPCSIEINSTINIISQSDIGIFGIKADADVSRYKILIKQGAPLSVIWHDDGFEATIDSGDTIDNLISLANSQSGWGRLYSKNNTLENIPILNYDTDAYPENAFTFSLLPEFVEFERCSERFYSPGASEWHWYDGFDESNGSEDNGYFTFDKLKYMIKVNGSLAYLGIESFNFYLTNAKMYNINPNVIDVGEISNFIDKSDDGTTLTKDIDYLFYNNTLELFNEFGINGDSVIIGTNYKLEWNSTNLPESDFVKIELSRNGKMSWETISDSIANTGVYNWSVVGSTGSDCYFKVSDAAQPDEIFGITPSFKIVMSTDVNEDTFYCKSTPIIDEYMFETYGNLVGLDRWKNYDQISSIAAIHGLMKANQNIDDMETALNIYYRLPIAPDGGRVIGLYESYGYEITAINGNAITLNIENALSPLIAEGSKMMCEGVGDVLVTSIINTELGQIAISDVSGLSVGSKLYLKLVNRSKIISYVHTDQEYIVIENNINVSCINHLINTMFINNRYPEVLVYASDIDGVYHITDSRLMDDEITLTTYIPSDGSTLYNDEVEITKIDANVGYVHIMWPTHKFLYILLDSGHYYKAYLDAPMDTIFDTDDRIEKFCAISRNASMKKFPGWNEFNYFRRQSGINYVSDLVKMISVIPGAEFGKYFPSAYSTSKNYI
jgi:hypothetical protein